MLHRLCGSPSIPLSFILANVLPQVEYLLRLQAAPRSNAFPTPSIHRLRGLPGYLILFAPHAEPQRHRPVSRLRHWCSSNIYAFHRYTRNSRLPSDTLVRRFQCSTGVGPLAFTSDLPHRLRSLYNSVNSDNACTIRITAAAGVFSQCSFLV